MKMYLITDGAMVSHWVLHTWMLIAQSIWVARSCECIDATIRQSFKWKK